jgi:Flp pilus assembly protein TadD
MASWRDRRAARSPPESTLAEGHYREALALAEALGMRPLQAHCHLGLGTLYSRVGRLEEARAALSTALHMYRTMEMSLWLPQVEAMLVQIGGRLQRQA